MPPTALLSRLYGSGASAAFKAACEAERVVEAESPDGSVRCYVTWTDGSSMKVDCSASEVYFQALESNRDGLYTDLCETLPGLFADWGVTTFRANAADRDSEAVLLKRGGWQRHGNGLEWAI